MNMINNVFSGGLSPENTGKRMLLIFLVSYTVILLVITGYRQFSCYPMITGGVLPKFCNTEPRKLEIIKDVRTHGDTLLILASDPKSEESVLRALTNSLNIPKVAGNLMQLQQALAYNSKTPVDVLDAFVKSEDAGILEQIAQRKNATPELLREVANNAKSNELMVQKALVNNPQIPEDVLQKLAKSEKLEILFDIVKLKNSSGSVLREVANNPNAKDLRIQRPLASNPNTPEDVLKSMADSSKDTRVLSSIINHPSGYTSVSILLG